MKAISAINNGDLTLVPLNFGYTELVRTWRNELRFWFFDSHFIEPDEQTFWFLYKYLPDPNDCMWVACWHGQPIGTGALYHIDLKKREAEWGRLMIGEPSVRGQGLAGRISRVVRDYGLDNLNLDRMYGSLLTANEVIMHVDMAAGYMPYHVEGDITYVELLRKDWRE